MLNDLVLTVLGKLASKASELAPGTYKVDQTVTIRVTGTVTKGQPVTYTPTNAVPLKATLAFMLARMGFQREAAADLLAAAMTDAINAGEGGNEAVSGLMEDVDRCMERVEAITAALPPKTRKGATTVKEALVQLIVPMPAVSPPADEDQQAV